MGDIYAFFAMIRYLLDVHITVADNKESCNEILCCVLECGGASMTGGLTIKHVNMSLAYQRFAFTRLPFGPIFKLRITRTHSYS